MPAKMLVLFANQQASSTMGNIIAMSTKEAKRYNILAW